MNIRTACSLATASMIGVLSGCRSVVQPIPGPGRDGEFYAYTQNYNDPDLGFALVGKSFCMGFRDCPMHWEEVTIKQFTLALPFSLAYLVEWYGVCPIVDTVMLPYDWIFQSCSKQQPRRLTIRLEDHVGAPLKEVELDVVRKKIRRGNISGRQEIKLSTDENGCVTLPFPRRAQIVFSGNVLLENGNKTFLKGEINDDSWIWETSAHHEPIRRRNGSFDALFLRGLKERCPMCRESTVWSEAAICELCGKELPKNVAQRRVRRLCASIKCRSLTDEECKRITCATGVPRDVLGKFFGVAPENAQGWITIRL